MAKNTSISLGDHFETYVSDKVRSGRYSSASEVVREGLRRLEQDDLKFQALRARLDLGHQEIQNGEVSDYSLKKINEKLLKEVGE